MLITQCKQILKDLLPPLFVRMYRSIRKPGIRFKGNYSNWAEASIHATGYNSEAILAKVKEALLKVKAGEAVYERDSVLFDQVQYSFPVLAALLRVAMVNDGKLSVLDFGGSLGSSYYQNRSFLRDLKSLRWNIVEQSTFVKCGKENFENEELKFYYTIEECLEQEKPKVILLSSVIQYLEKPYEFLDNLCGSGIDYILLDRTPLSMTDDRLTVQIVPTGIYLASYPSWIFSRDKLINILLKNYSLLLEFKANDGCITSGQTTVCYQGFFLKKCIQ